MYFKDVLTSQTAGAYAAGVYTAGEIIIREILAYGGYGVVYKGKIKKSRKIVAVKTLLTTRYQNKNEYDQRFNKEVVNYRYAACCPHNFFL